PPHTPPAPTRRSSDLTVDTGVDVALTRPHVQVLPPGPPANMCAEELVGTEQHLGLLRNRVHHIDRVRGRATHVGLRLHLGCGVQDRKSTRLNSSHVSI